MTNDAKPMQIMVYHSWESGNAKNCRYPSVGAGSTPDELKKVTLKEIHWLCDGLSINPKGAFEEHHPKIVV